MRNSLCLSLPRLPSRELRLPALAPERLLSLDGLRPGRVLRARGRVWLTQSGDPRDHILEPGETWVCGGTGRVLVQGLAPRSQPPDCPPRPGPDSPDWVDAPF